MLRLLSSNRVEVRLQKVPVQKVRSVSVGDVFDAEVKEMSSLGQGVVKHPKGLTCFVSGVWTGESGKFKITELKRGFAQARVIEFSNSSTSRQPAPCQYHGFESSECGGCPWMFVNYQAQLSEKQRRVSAAIGRIDERWSARVLEIIGSPNALGYRNRTQLKSDGHKLGFIASKSHTLVDVETCSILTPALSETLKQLRQTLPNSDWSPKRNSHKRGSNSRSASARGSLARSKSPKPSWTSVDIDDETPSDMASINQRLPFKQANDEQNDRMKHWLRKQLEAIAADEHDAMKIVELFCGSGNFTEVLAGHPSASVIAAEGSEEAIATLRAKNWPSVSAFVVNLFESSAFKAFLRKCRGMDILFLDPPRDGLKEKEGLFVKSVRPRHVLYVSCDLATFCRDLVDFKQNGYTLDSLQPIDLFPQTPHVELMAKLSVKKK